MKSMKRKRGNKSADFQQNKKVIHNEKQNNGAFESGKKKRSKDDGIPVQRKKIKFAKSDDISEAATDFEPRRKESVLKHLIAKPGLKWYEQTTPEEFEKQFESTSAPNLELVSTLMEEAVAILKEDEVEYKKFLERRQEKSDFSWIKTVVRSGTVADKISAHTLLIQDCPVHNINSIRVLIGMVNTKGKRECIMAMDCLKDLFLSDLLREEKKFKSFTEHPVEKLDMMAKSKNARKKMLLFWYFEDQLKQLYASFTKNLQAVSHDTIEKTKQKAVTVMCELLKDSPEQEQFLLESLVNKIGDPVPKVGSHVCHLLGQVVYRHKKMLAVVIQEVERLLFRANVAERAKYYCLCFYNQLILSEEQSNIANHLITIYFGLFKACIKKGEVNTKMMSALLTGVSRAYPYAKLKNNVMMEQLDAMFRLVHIVNFNISVQALMLIFQVLDSNDSISDRFYSALYRKILDPALSSSTRQTMLLNLIYKALKKDNAKVRVKAFTKRLIQIALCQTPNFQCGILMLISNLLRTHPEMLETIKIPVDSDSDSDEHFEDITDQEDDENGNSNKSTSNETATSSKSSAKVSSWIHRGTKRPVKVKRKHDPLNRNPLHCGAEYSNLWELRYLKNSFHPSVSLFAHQVYNLECINYNGDPLQDFTLIRFLDRFVFRNPKKQSHSTTADSHRKVFGKRYLSKSESQSVDITSDTYRNQNEEKVPVEERFIYKYLKQRAAFGKPKKDYEDLESVGSDEFESLLNRVHPEDEGKDKDALDFAKELSLNKQKASKNKKKVSASNDESDGDDLESLGGESDFEEEFDLENDPEFQNAFGELSDMEEGPENETEACDDFIDNDVASVKQARRKKQKRETNLFASADEFDVMLEENMGKMADTTSEAFVNYDNSDAKQLAWEKQRDQFVRGTDWKSRKNKFKKKFPNKKGRRT